jgi:hypothetical protein
MLSAAGFKAIPANSPQRVDHLNSLPDETLTAANLNGHHFPLRSQRTFQHAKFAQIVSLMLPYF